MLMFSQKHEEVVKAKNRALRSLARAIKNNKMKNM